MSALQVEINLALVASTDFQYHLNTSNNTIN
jgi:hypothetical protein